MSSDLSDIDAGASTRSEARSPADPLAGLPQFEDVVAACLGTTAQVFRARHRATGRWVAVKVFGPAGHGCRIRRYERELAITSRLCGHPYIITVLEHGLTPGGRPYLVTPWYDRGSLAAELGRRGPMPVTGVLAMGVRMAAALDRAHSMGVCHRDVKPANILLSGSGESVLADFGESVSTASFTPGYAAPEVLRYGVADQRSDVWSLASTLYTALAGHRPFATGPGSDGLGDELARTVHDPLPPLTRPDVPAPLAGLLARGLGKRPADRPTARELATALQHLQVDGGRPVTQIPGQAEPFDDPPPPPRPVAMAGGDPPTVVRVAPVDPQPGRRPLATAAIAAIVTLTLAIGGVLVAAQRPGPDRSPRTQATMTVTADRSGRPSIDVAAYGLRVVGRSATAVELAWQDPNDRRVRYFVLIDPDRRNAGPVLAATSTGHTVVGLRPGTGYCFRVVTGDADIAPVTPPVCARTR